MFFAVSEGLRGTAARRTALAVLLILVLTASLATLGWQALSSAKALRMAFERRAELIQRAGDIKLRAVQLQVLQSEALIAALRGEGPAARLRFEQAAQGLRRSLSALLAERWTGEERQQLEQVYGALMGWLRNDASQQRLLDAAAATVGPLPAPAPVGPLSASAARDPLAAARAEGVRGSLALLAAIDQLARTQRAGKGGRGDALDARERELRLLLGSATGCALLLAAFFTGLWLRTLRSQGRLRERLERASLVDEATGLPNRRAWDERLTAELARAVRHGSVVSVLVARVQAAAPAVARRGTDPRVRAARTWRAALRRDDFVARIGADEFAFILPSCNAGHAASMAGRLQRMVQPAVRLRAGIASWDRREPAEVLAERAGEALERALRQSESPVCIAEASRTLQAV
jgi:diguanylate cyclase (GGDEF)-like protein